jgi:hypothetical protein
LCAAPIKRAAFLLKTILNGDMVCPGTSIAHNSDAMLQHVASWGDRSPHKVIKGRRPKVVKDEGQQDEGQQGEGLQAIAGASRQPAASPFAATITSIAGVPRQ